MDSTVSTIHDLRPGMIGFGPIAGPVGVGINIGQRLLGQSFQIGKRVVEHVFVVVNCPDIPGQAHCVEAMPSGAREYPFMANRWTSAYAYAQLPEDYPGQSLDAAAIARAMIGTPYSFASYAAIALDRWTGGWPSLDAWIDRRLEPVPIDWPSGRQDTATGHLGVRLPREAICSVLADQAWTLTGKQVMPAGTKPQAVSPGALAGALLQTPGVTWLWPS